MYAALLHHGDRGADQPVARAGGLATHFFAAAFLAGAFFAAAFFAGAFLAAAFFAGAFLAGESESELELDPDWRFFTLASSLANRSETSSVSSSSVGFSSTVKASLPSSFASTSS